MPESSPDPRPLLARSFRQASALVAGVGADTLRRPTPCADFDVEGPLGHLVFVTHRVAGIGRGEPQTDDGLSGEVPDDDWSRAFAAGMDDALAAWLDDSLLTREMTLPWATLPGPQMARIYALELVIHGWDLAMATGQTSAPDPELAESVLPIAFEALPAEPRGGEIPLARWSRSPTTPPPTTGWPATPDGAPRRGPGTRASRWAMMASPLPLHDPGDPCVPHVSTPTPASWRSRRSRFPHPGPTRSG